MKNHRIISKESEKCDGLDDNRWRYDPDSEFDEDDEKEHREGDGDDRADDWRELLEKGSEQVRFGLVELD